MLNPATHTGNFIVLSTGAELPLEVDVRRVSGVSGFGRPRLRHELAGTWSELQTAVIAYTGWV